MKNERLLANFLSEILPLEQCRYNMYHEENIYSRMPVLVFRIAKGFNDNLYNELRESVESFQGNLKWTEYESFAGKRVKNHIISPIEYYEFEMNSFHNNFYQREQDYFQSDIYKRLCELAINDIPDLYLHLKENFKPHIDQDALLKFKGNRLTK